MKWLIDFSEAAAKTDQLVGNPNHAALLGAGLMGEVGSILAEVKKERRERNAYPAYHRKLLEEIGDFYGTTPDSFRCQTLRFSRNWTYRTIL